MIANTIDTLFRGMEVLTKQMGIIEAEKFIFLIKSENFDYTEWQRKFFDNIPPEKLRADMADYFASHDDSCPNAVQVSQSLKK